MIEQSFAANPSSFKGHGRMKRERDIIYIYIGNHIRQPKRNICTWCRRNWRQDRNFLAVRLRMVRHIEKNSSFLINDFIK